MAYITRQYQAVLQCLEARESAPFTAAELAEDLRLEGHPVGLATVYRQLERLEAEGQVHKIPTEDGALYQRCPHPAPGRACTLLRCEACGRILHLDCAQLEDLYRHLEAIHRFRIDPRRTVLTGRCQHCMELEEEDPHDGTP